MKNNDENREISSPFSHHDKNGESGEKFDGKNGKYFRHFRESLEKNKWRMATISIFYTSPVSIPTKLLMSRPILLFVDFGSNLSFSNFGNRIDWEPDMRGLP